jgi:hypothetical protein
MKRVYTKCPRIREGVRGRSVDKAGNRPSYEVVPGSRARGEECGKAGCQTSIGPYISCSGGVDARPRI